MCCLDYWKEV
jgi:hypothetical protein